MSLRAHLWALDQAPVKNPTAVLVLVALADESNDDGEAACPYMDKIKQRARCSERAAQEHLRNLYRARLIDLGDEAVARRRYKKSGGRVPRVWNLNLAASWAAVPTPRTDAEMLAYSDKIGQRPVRRNGEQEEPSGVQILHPANAGVQNLHPTGEQQPDQQIDMAVDQEDQVPGCSPPHPWGAAPRTPGVQPPAPFPSLPADTRPTSSCEAVLTEGATLAAADESQDEIQTTAAAVVEAAQTAGQAPKRVRAGADLARLRAMAAAALRAGWHPPDLVEAVGADLRSAGSVFAVLEKRLRPETLGPPPAAVVAPAAPAQRQPCPPGCSSGVVAVGDGLHCPRCRPGAHARQLADTRGQGYDVATFADMVALVEAVAAGRSAVAA